MNKTRKTIGLSLLIIGLCSIPFLLAFAPDGAVTMALFPIMAGLLTLLLDPKSPANTAKPTIPTRTVPPASTPNKTFVCASCHTEKNIKYMHKNQLCVDCWKPKTDIPSHSTAVAYCFGEGRPDLIGAPYREYRDGQANRILYELFRIPPSPEWEIAIIGLDVRTGKAWQQNARQKSYGAFLGSEDEWHQLSYDDVRELAIQNNVSKANYAGLNENTWEHYIPQAFMERVIPKAPQPTVYPANHFARHGHLDADAIFVRTRRRFGEDFQFLRKCSTGYRALSVSNADAGQFIYGNIPTCPDEEFILNILENRKSIGCVNIADRLLSNDDLQFIVNSVETTKLFHAPRRETASANISIYGGEIITAYFCVNGRVIPCAGKAAHDVGSAISSCVRGIKKG